MIPNDAEEKFWLRFHNYLPRYESQPNYVDESCQNFRKNVSHGLCKWKCMINLSHDGWELDDELFEFVQEWQDIEFKKKRNAKA